MQHPAGAQPQRLCLPRPACLLRCMPLRCLLPTPRAPPPDRAVHRARGHVTYGAPEVRLHPAGVLHPGALLALTATATRPWVEDVWEGRKLTGYRMADASAGNPRRVGAPGRHPTPRCHPCSSLPGRKGGGVQEGRGEVLHARGDGGDGLAPRGHQPSRLAGPAGHGRRGGNEGSLTVTLWQWEKRGVNQSDTTARGCWRGASWLDRKAQQQHMHSWRSRNGTSGTFCAIKAV